MYNRETNIENNCVSDRDLKFHILLNMNKLRSDNLAGVCPSITPRVTTSGIDNLSIFYMTSNDLAPSKQTPLITFHNLCIVTHGPQLFKYHFTNAFFQIHSHTPHLSLPIWHSSADADSWRIQGHLRVHLEHQHV